MRYFHGERSIPLVPFSQSVVERPGTRRASAPFLRCATTTSLVMSLAVGSPHSALAQAPASTSASNPVLITGHDMLLLASATAASAAVSAFDVTIARHLTDPVFHSEHSGARSAAVRASQGSWDGPWGQRILVLAGPVLTRATSRSVGREAARSCNSWWCRRG